MGFHFFTKTFDTFYASLRRSFQKKIDPSETRIWRADDNSIWKQNYPDTNSLAIYHLFGLSHISYWTEKKSRHNNSDKMFIEEPPAVFIEAFKLMGYKLDASWYQKNINLKGKTRLQAEAEQLYTAFLKKECLKIINKADLLQFDKLIIKNVNNVSKKQVKENVDFLETQKFEHSVKDFIESVFLNLKNNDVRKIVDSTYCGLYDNIKSKLIPCERADNVQVFNIKREYTSKHYNEDGQVAYADVSFIIIEKYHTSEELDDFLRCSIDNYSFALRILNHLEFKAKSLGEIYNISQIKFSDILSHSDVTYKSTEQKKVIEWCFPDVRYRPVAQLHRYKLIKSHERWNLLDIMDILDVNSRSFLERMYSSTN